MEYIQHSSPLFLFDGLRIALGVLATAEALPATYESARLVARLRIGAGAGAPKKAASKGKKATKAKAAKKDEKAEDDVFDFEEDDDDLF